MNAVIAIIIAKTIKYLPGFLADPIIRYFMLVRKP
jgi:hypothetical protein